MERSPLVHVVILYLHPLLGEGLAKLLSAEPGVAVRAVYADDGIAAALALAEHPDVVVEEREGGARAPKRFEHGYTPLRLFVGIGGSRATDGDEPMTVDPDLIVRAVRGLKQQRSDLVRA